MQLYETYNGTTNRGEIVVKNINSATTAPRVLKETGNSNVPWHFKYLQRDKYGNILLSSVNSTLDRNKYIHKIDDPNNYSGSTVTLNHIDLNGNTTGLAYLPELIPIVSPACPNMLSVAANVTTGIDKKQTANSIAASNTISSGASAIYHAGTTVVLSANFHAVSGSKFRGYIEGCSGTFVAKKGSFENEQANAKGNDAKNQTEHLRIFPNPSNSMVTILAESAPIKRIVIRSITDG